MDAAASGPGVTERGGVRTGRAARVGAALLLAGVLTGCGGAAPAEPAPAPTGGATGGTDAAVCNEFSGTGRSAFRQAVEAAQGMPVLPAAVAIIGLGPRQVASTAGAENPELVAAQEELVAAIDDLDAQGRELLGPEGDAAQDAVQLDVARALAALDEIERICAA